MKALLPVENEALLARLSIRDFFLNNIVREIYENVGQVLSLVRMELACARSDGNLKTQMESAGQLVGQSIRDLRSMTKSFNPDTDLLKEDGFTESIKKIIEILYPSETTTLCLKGKQNTIQEEVKLIVFSVLLKMLISQKNEKKMCNELVVSFTKSTLKITLRFDYKGVNSEDVHIKNSFNRFNKDIRLIWGTLDVSRKKNGMHTWKLTIPVK